MDGRLHTLLGNQLCLVVIQTLASTRIELAGRTSPNIGGI